MQDEGRPDPAELQQAFNRLAGLLRQPQARERMRKDPGEFLGSNDIVGVPEAAVTALATLSPEELEVFSRVHGKLAGISDELGGPEVCIVF